MGWRRVGGRESAREGEREGEWEGGKVGEMKRNYVKGVVHLQRVGEKCTQDNIECSRTNVKTGLK